MAQRGNVRMVVLQRSDLADKRAGRSSCGSRPARCASPRLTVFGGGTFEAPTPHDRVLSGLAAVTLAWRAGVDLTGAEQETLLAAC